jgi:hypothetical protein
MPGVVVTTTAVAGPSAPTRAPSSTYFVVGQAERGATDQAVLVNSFPEFEANFGVRTAYGALWDDVRTFFEEGGTRAYVARVVGPAATTGALASALMDQHATTPVATLNVTAAGPGAWSSTAGVRVLAGTTTDTFRLQVLSGGVVVRDYSNLHSPQEAVSRVNSDPLNYFVRLADAASATAAPLNNPAPTAALTLAAGTDDRASITATHYTTALTRFTKALGDGAVAVPGIGSSVHAALITHADDNNRIAILAGARGDTQTTLSGLADTADAKRAALYAPWVRVSDGFGGTRAISPEGYVAAVRAKAHETEGPWKAAAGEISKGRYVVAADEEFSSTTAGELDSARVNVIRTIAGSVRVYGARSTSSDDNWSYITSADTVNRVVVACEQVLEPYVFATIDSSGHLLATMRGSLIGVVQPMADARGLFALYNTVTGDQIDPGYSVTTDETINPVASLALNQVYARVGVRPSPTASMVFLTVTKAGVTAAL